MLSPFARPARAQRWRHAKHRASSPASRLTSSPANKLTSSTSLTSTACARLKLGRAGAREILNQPDLPGACEQHADQLAWRQMKKNPLAPCAPARLASSAPAGKHRRTLLCRPLAEGQVSRLSGAHQARARSARAGLRLSHTQVTPSCSTPVVRTRLDGRGIRPGRASQSTRLEELRPTAANERT